MKAIRISSYGGYEVLKIETDVKINPLGENQLLVEVYAASINPFDSLVIKGYVKDAMPLTFPITPGADFSGKVLDIGKQVGDFKIGDGIYGSSIVFGGGSGAFAQKAVVNSRNIAIKPKGIGFEEAASLPLVGVSAIQALEENIKLTGNQKILIHGGAGGIGTMAIQLAKYLGAYVATTVSGKDTDYVKKLGADEAINYKSEKFENRIKNYDAVFDTIGGEVLERSFAVLKKGGVITSMKGLPDRELAGRYGVLGIATNTSVITRRLMRLSDLVERGVIKPQIDRIFNLDETAEAFVYKDQNPVRGKVVIKIK